MRVRACEDEAAIIVVNFGDRPANNGTNRIALKRAFDWYGGHIVFWSNFDLSRENPALGWICKLLIGFLTLFLAESIQ